MLTWRPVRNIRISSNIAFRAIGVFCLLLLLASCTSLPSVKPDTLDAVSQRCLNYYEKMDELVQQQGVSDAQYARLQGYPFLRINRYLQSFRYRNLSQDQTVQWLDSLARLDRKARSLEFRNLETGLRNELNQLLPLGKTHEESLLFCGKALVKAYMRSPADLESLRIRMEMPSEYSQTKRALGLYPLSSLIVENRVAAYQREQKRKFTTPPAQGNVAGRLVRYTFGGEAGSFEEVVSDIDLPTKAEGLYPPQLSAENLKRLFIRHAPVWEIDQISLDDHIGSPYWADKSTLAVNTENPLVYLIPSFAQFEGQALIQLNYLVWFPARTKKGALDLYGGFLDGVFLRVTLGENLEPIMYETVHSCGCYHVFHPTDRVELKRTKESAEPPLAAPAVSIPQHDENLIVRMSAGEHQVLGLYTESKRKSSVDRQYKVASYHPLRELKTAWGTSQSMFNNKGLVPQSKRLERLLLWVTGVESAGAMRQWGRHAIAFAEERYFDEPFLIETFFKTHD